MQKWLPDAFSTESVVGSAVAEEAPAFESTAQQERPDDPATRFRSESGFADAPVLLHHLTRKEKAEVYDLVEQDVAAQYEEREAELRRQLTAELQEKEQHFSLALENLSRQLQAALGTQLKDVSTACARLAVQMAEKIVRCHVSVDPEVLIRSLDTIQYRLLDSGPLHLTVNPEDAQALQARPETLQGLGVAEVQADRRVERGGCLVRVGRREWDATLARQIEALGEMVEEAASTATEDPLQPLDEETHEPAVE